MYILTRILMVVFFYHDQLCYFPDYLYQCHFSVCLLVFLPSCISYMFLCLVHCLMFLSICFFKFSPCNFYFLVQGIWKDKLHTSFCLEGDHSHLRKECALFWRLNIFYAIFIYKQYNYYTYI